VLDWAIDSEELNGRSCQLPEMCAQQRALALNIVLLRATDPNGRIERAYRTLQDLLARVGSGIADVLSHRTAASRQACRARRKNDGTSCRGRIRLNPSR
jgi:hypothetical protein